MLPKFLVVGAAKAGTTAIHHYLGQHPEIFVPREFKESFFFAEISDASFPGPGHAYAHGAITALNHYRALFEEAKTGDAVGEVCVAYLYFHEVAIPRIRRERKAIRASPSSISCLVPGRVFDCDLVPCGALSGGHAPRTR